MTGSPHELVSIGLPTYSGGAPYMKRAINSALAQTYRNIELIITENPAIDGTCVTQKLCEEFARKDRRVRYVRHATDIGTNANYTSSLDNALGEYFCWIGFDDFLHPRFIEQCVARLESDKEAVVAMSDYEFVDPEGKFSHRIDPQTYVVSDRGLYERLKTYTLKTWTSGKVIYIHGLWRRDVIAEDPLGELPDGDVNFVFRRLARGTFLFVPEVLFYKGLLPGGESRENEKFTPVRIGEAIMTRIKLVPAQFWNTSFIFGLKELLFFSRVKLFLYSCMVATRLFTRRRY